jgi:hypothetical protein
MARSGAIQASLQDRDVVREGIENVTSLASADSYCGVKQDVMKSMNARNRAVTCRLARHNTLNWSVSWRCCSGYDRSRPSRISCPIAKVRKVESSPYVKGDPDDEAEAIYEGV